MVSGGPGSAGAGPTLLGMTVLDLTQQLPGPFATALLAALGARVVKVEPPSGDPARRLDPQMFDRVNAGKESVVLDLKSCQGRAALHRLVAASDVLLEGFRPGVMARLGADWATCRRLNPRLVYCSLSGFGPDGPYANVPVHDLNLLAWGDAEGARLSSGRIGVPWVDLGTGTTAALLVVAAWHAAREAGTGRALDVSMQDVALSWARAKVLRGRQPTYGVYRTADGKEVVLAALEDHFWQRLCRAFGLDSLAADPTLGEYAGRMERADEIHGAVRDALARRTLREVLTVAAEHDVPVTTVDPAEDPRAMEHLAQSAFGDGAFRLPIGAGAVSAAPRCGEHTASVLAELAGGDTGSPQ